MGQYGQGNMGMAEEVIDGWRPVFLSGKLSDVRSQQV